MSSEKNVFCPDSKQRIHAACSLWLLAKSVFKAILSGPTCDSLIGQCQGCMMDVLKPTRVVTGLLQQRGKQYME
jgi:hypothetical protein